MNEVLETNGARTGLNGASRLVIWKRAGNRAGSVWRDKMKIFDKDIWKSIAIGNSCVCVYMCTMCVYIINYVLYIFTYT